MTIYRKLIILSVILTLTLSSCSGGSYSHTVFMMDTYVTVEIPDTFGASEAVNTALALASDIENAISRTVSGSDINRINGGETPRTLSAYTTDVLSEALKIALLSDGAYDPTVEPLVTLWNISHGEARIPEQSEIERALSNVGYDKITLNGGGYSASSEVSLDLGGIGKGYACEAVAGSLRESGIKSGYVSFGGNIGIVGNKPDGSGWKIGIRDPDDANGVIGYMRITEGYISVSGDYERYFELDGRRYHHILDPQTGYPASNGIRSVAVWSNNGAEADALSTALFVMGREAALDFYATSGLSFEAVIVAADGITLTDGLLNGSSIQWIAK